MKDGPDEPWTHDDLRDRGTSALAVAVAAALETASGIDRLTPSLEWTGTDGFGWAVSDRGGGHVRAMFTACGRRVAQWYSDGPELRFYADEDDLPGRVEVDLATVARIVTLATVAKRAMGLRLRRADRGVPVTVARDLFLVAADECDEYSGPVFEHGMRVRVEDIEPQIAWVNAWDERGNEVLLSDEQREAIVAQAAKENR